MRLDTILKNVGFSEREARVYLGLLSLGESNVKKMADKANLPRTSIYTPIKNLLDKGFLAFYKKKGRNYYVAVRPREALKIIEERLGGFKENLLRFEALSVREHINPKIRFFVGKEGIRLVLNLILEEKRPFLAVTCIEDMQNIAQDYFEDFIERRIRQNLQVKLLTNRSPESEALRREDDKSLRETRFVPHEYHFNTANYIFGDNVAILSLQQEPATAILVEDAAVAETHRMYFDLIWKMASSG